MPRGTGPQTYKGLALPGFGNPTLKGVSTADVLTIEHSTADQGNFLVFRDSASSLFPESTLTAGDVLRFGAGGTLTISPNATAPYTVSSAGVVQGAKMPVIEVSTVGDFTITSTMSGTLLNVGENGTSQMLILPVNPEPGFWVKVFVSTQDEPDDVRINTTVDSSAKIVLAGMTSLVSTVDSIAPLSSLGQHSVTLTAVTSILWLAEQYTGYAETATSDFSPEELFHGAWTSGSTAG